MFGIMQHLKVAVCPSPEAASEAGFIYDDTSYTRVEISTVVVVHNGTQDGNATVDIQLVDEQGNKYVVMVTANLLKSLPL